MKKLKTIIKIATFILGVILGFACLSDLFLFLNTGSGTYFIFNETSNVFLIIITLLIFVYIIFDSLFHVMCAKSLYILKDDLQAIVKESQDKVSNEILKDIDDGKDSNMIKQKIKTESYRGTEVETLDTYKNLK